MVNYYLDISEAEYKDTTQTVSVFNEITKTDEKTHPVYVGFPYRMMQTMMITNSLPILTWNVSITPIKAHYTMYYQTWSDFLVHICGIMGGIFAAASIFQSII